MQMQTMLTISQLCERFQCSRDLIEKELKNGRLAGTKIGGTWRFTQDAIEDYIKSRTLKIKKQPC